MVENCTFIDIMPCSSQKYKMRIGQIIVGGYHHCSLCGERYHSSELHTCDIQIINFISTFDMYDKECTGIKPNTLRKLSEDKEKKLNAATHIRIRKGYTKESFIRKITDKTKWDGFWIISWNPEEKNVRNN